MKIAVFGPGTVGSGLARFWVDAGHEVRLTFARDQEKLETTAAEIGATSAEPSAAAAWADVVVLATPWAAVADAIASAGSLDGKVLVDATNNLQNHEESGTDTVARLADGARVVKAFNTLFALLFEQLRAGGMEGDVIYCGDDSEAKETVAQLIRDVGLDPVDVGPLSSALHMDNFCRFQIDIAYVQGRGPFLYRFFLPT